MNKPIVLILSLIALLLACAWYILRPGTSLNISAKAIMDEQALSNRSAPSYKKQSPVANPSLNDDPLSGSSSVFLQAQPVDQQIKSLAFAHKPSAELVARLEEFEGAQLDILEEVQAYLSMKEEDFTRAEDGEEGPVYAENPVHQSDDVYELASFTQFVGECFRTGFTQRSPSCVSIYSVNPRLSSIRPPRAIDNLDKAALQGDLLAQSLYHSSLLSAVDSFDMNTARDSQLWVLRRQRMIEYSLKFSKAGSPRATEQLAELFDHSDYIVARPFWAAVFYHQLELQGGSGEQHYRRLLTEYLLDEQKVLQAREYLYGSGSD